MGISQKTLLLAGAVALLLAGVAIGSWLGSRGGQTVSAQTDCTVDRTILTKLYNAIFHRSLDAGADSHLNRPLNVVLDALSASQEHEQYTGVFTAVKALEEAKRAPGTLSQSEKKQYTDLINSALSTVSAWADALPEQAIENRVIGPDQARASIQKAYDNLNPVAKTAAEYGLFNALEKIGAPSTLPIPSLPPRANISQ